MQMFKAVRVALGIVAGLCTLGSVAFGYQGVPVSGVDEKSGIAIDAAMPFRQTPGSGFCPLHFKIVNRTSESHSWDLTFNFGGFGGRRSTMRYSTTLAVGPGQTREWDLLIPRAGLENRNGGYESISGAITGYGVSGGRFMLPSYYSGGYNRSAFTVMTETLGTAAWSKIESELKTVSSTPTAEHPDLLYVRNGGSSSSRGSRELAGSQVNLNELPPDWRAFSGVGGLWLSSNDWEKLSTDRRRAIRQWVTAGGNLFVASQGDTIERLPLLPANLTVGKKQPLGLGVIEAVKLKNGELSPSETAQQILGLDDAPLPAWQEEYEDSWKLAEFVGFPSLNVPLVIGFVSLFAIVIGPLNLRWFAPPKRRARLFFTIPLFSAGASVALLGVIAVGDGFGGSGGRNALLYIPAGENQITMVQEQMSRSRLLFGRSFKMPETVQLCYVQQDRQSDSGLNFERSGDIVAGDWFRSRTVQTHVMRVSMPSRAEVVLQPGSGAPDAPPSLLSSVASPLRDVHFIDANGRYWKAEKLETGRPAKLEPSTKDALEEWYKQHCEDVSRNLRAVVLDTLHRPGHFYAVADKMPEAPLDTLGSIRWNKEKVLCVGTSIGAENK
ncbi:hypothetical protein ACXR0O_21360 [Verrucomicrobiota bacterium sgz303538]